MPEDVFQVAKRKARYGHRDWLVWTNRHGIRTSAVKSPESVKRCLLESGTKGRWSLICSDGAPMVGYWWIGLNLLRQMKVGVY